MTERKMINIAQPSFLGNEKKYLLDTIDSGWISSIGPYIEKFEQEFARYHGVRHAIATHNGTIALHLALVAAGITKDDEVIVPDFTFIATANSVRYCNARPILTDVDSDDWNISPEAVRANITPKTKAIIPVHLYGNPARMDEITEIAKEHNIIVIEDCAEALGALYKKKNVGTIGDIGCFSFFGNKIITTGEGGMCITNNDFLAERMRILRDHGMNRKKKYQYDFLGFNYRMTNMQAAIGLAQLEQLNDLLKIRDEIYCTYKTAFTGSQGIVFQETHENRNVNWIFTVRLNGLSDICREAVMADLKAQNIDSRPAFYPIHQMDFYKHGDFFRTIPENSIRISREGISLPTFIGLDYTDIRFIAATLIESFGKQCQ
ncbi:MAG: DegT/DnrJ/EryC1/StrS family aminotransferase [Bacteroidota bacterium]